MVYLNINDNLHGDKNDDVMQNSDVISSINSDQDTQFKSVTIKGELRLLAREVSHEVVFVDVTFLDHVDLTDSRFRRSLCFRNCRFNAGFNGAGIRVDGRVDIEGSSFFKSPNGTNALSLYNAEINGNVLAAGIESKGDVNLAVIKVRGRCNFSSKENRQTAIHGHLLCQKIQIDQQLSCIGIDVSGELYGDNLYVGGELYLQSSNNYQTVFSDQIRLPRATIRGEVDLSGCRVVKGIYAPYARIDGPVLLRRGNSSFCEFGSLEFQHSQCQSSFELFGARITGDLDFHSASLGGGLLLQAVELSDGAEGPRFVEIQGNLQLANVECSGSIIFNGVSIQNNVVLYAAKIKSDVNVLSFKNVSSRIGEDLVLAHGSFGSQVAISGVHVEGSIDLEQSDIGGTFFCTTSRDGSRSQIDGDISLLVSKVGGQVNLSDLILGGSLIVQNSVLQADLVCEAIQNRSSMINGTITLRSTDVMGSVVFDGIQLTGDLRIVNTSISNSLSLSANRYSRARISGATILSGTKLLGRLTATGTLFAETVTLHNCELSQGMFFNSDDRQGLEIEGDLEIISSRIGDGLSFGGIGVSGDLLITRSALSCGVIIRADHDRRARIGGDVSLRASHIADRLEIIGVEISGDLEADDATFERGGMIIADDNISSEIHGDVSMFSLASRKPFLIYGTQIGKCLLLHNAVVDGDLQCCSHNQHRTTVGGIIWLFRSKISGRCSFDGITASEGIKLTYATIDGGFTCLPTERDNPRINGTLSFHGARASDVVLDGQALAEATLDLVDAEFNLLELSESLPKAAELTGFRFQRIELPEGSNTNDLLECDPLIARDTYLFVEDFHRNRGETIQANRTYHRLCHRENALSPMFSLTRWRNNFLNWTIEYGTSAYRLVFIWLFLFVITWHLFSHPKSVKQTLILNGGDKTTSISQRKLTEIPKARTWDESAWTAVSITLPMLDAIPGDEWKPSSEEMILMNYPLWFTYESYAFVASILAWLLVPYYLATLAGLFKRRE